MRADRERCLAAGMNAHVAKPIEPEDLWTALLAWIAPRPLAAEALPAVVTRVGTHLDAHVGETAAGDDDLPTGIDGLDTVLGLRRGLGKRALYLSMLRGFVAGQRDAVAATRQALDVDDWTSAERHAHTLKGVAANVGATGVSDLAQALEAAIRERLPRAEVNARLEALRIPLATLTGALDRRLPAVPARAPVAVDRAALDAACDRLEALLVADDAGAGEHLAAHGDLLHSAFPREFRTIEADIRAFDSEAALETLRAARAAHAASA
jgi:two-component system sensor histidine kinase/response regulator